MKFQQLLWRQAVTPAKDPLLQHEWSGLVNSALRRVSEATLYVMNANIMDTPEQRDTVSSFASVASFNIADMRTE